MTRCTEHVAHMGEKKIHIGLWKGTLKERDYMDDQDVDERVILTWLSN